MQRVIDLFNQELPNFVQDAVERISSSKYSSYRNLARPQLEVLVQRGFIAFADDLLQGTNSHFQNHWQKIATARAQQGAQLAEVAGAIVSGAEVMDTQMQAALANDPEGRAWWLNRLYQIMLHGLLMLADVFIAVRERMITEQDARLRELSTPLIPIRQGILVLPLVGQIDQQRAGQILETLLEGISQHTADVVIMDVTGVPFVDTQVANYLIQAARAARLLGAQLVLVGLGAEIAQTIVQLGVDLRDITTLADLEAGITYALRLHGLAIAPIELITREH